MPNDTNNEREDKVTITFRCTPAMQEFLASQAKEESVATILRTWIREKMEAAKEPITA